MSEEPAEYRGREVRRETRLPYRDPRYEPPTAEEVRELIRVLGRTGSMVGDDVGVSSRSVRKWVGGEAPIPYAAWRLLLIEAGLALDGDAEKLRLVADGER